ncbi:MAG: hypothetical protein Kow00124_15050 [Anaerolineae bacterium]
MSEVKKLYRSRSEKMIGGVCGGLAHYLGIDPVLVRLIFVALTLANGIGAVLYLILWLLLPDEEASTSDGREVVRENVAEMRDRAKELGAAARKAVSTLRDGS